MNETFWGALRESLRTRWRVHLLSFCLGCGSVIVYRLVTR